ncbi:MAG: S8 family serine peptidase [Acidimicrobiia bacterium]
MKRSIAYVALGVLVGLVLAACSSTGFGEPNDPLASDQYAIEQHGMVAAWDRSTGEGVVIAVVDTGIDLNHPEFAGRLVAGYDFVDNDDIPDDLNGHGTHVSGSAAAIGNNNVGVVGMAPEAKIMPIKVLGEDGSGSTEDVAAGIVWAAENGADVINLSLGGSSDLLGRIFAVNGPTNDAIEEATKKGAVVVAAAGNDDTYLTAYNPDTPVLVVNATNELGEWARFSNFGDPRAVAAAGARIVSTAPTYPTTIWPEGTEGYGEISGTSMASPHVAGIAALLVSTTNTPKDIREIITETASNPTSDPLLGAGIVQAGEATEEAQQETFGFWLILAILVIGGGATIFIAWERNKNA